jgi:RNA polymerase sigma-70 factor (ECF subfamily)
LLVRVRDPADQAAWSEFDGRYGELIVRYCLSRGLQQSDAEDVRQAVLMSLASALRSFKYSPQRGRFRSYLGRVVRNAVIRFATRPNRTPLTLDSGVLSLTGDDDGQDERWEQQWRLHHLRLAMRAVRRTSEAKSVEVFDRLLAGASVAQVAEEKQMTREAVHKIKQRVRDRLRQLVAEQMADEEGVDGWGA